MKPGDGLLALLLEARLGSCGHPRQPHPGRPGVELPCATPGCGEGIRGERVEIIDPITPRSLTPPGPYDQIKTRHLVRSEAYIDGEDTPHPRFWLWRSA